MAAPVEPGGEPGSVSEPQESLASLLRQPAALILIALTSLLTAVYYYGGLGQFLTDHARPPHVRLASWVLLYLVAGLGIPVLLWGAVLRRPLRELGVRAAVVLLSGALLLPLAYFYGSLRWLGPWLDLSDQERLFGWFLLNFVGLFVIPSLLWRLVFRRPLAELGLRAGDWRLSLRYAALFAALAIPVILIASRAGGFQDYYARYFSPGQPWTATVLLQFGWLLYFFAWEYFFRGYLLFGLADRMGALAIAVQTTPFAIMHFPKPCAESFAAILAGIALGWMAYRTRSCLGPWLLHWVCSAVMVLAVAYW